METSAEKEQLCAGSCVCVFGGPAAAVADRKGGGDGQNHRTKVGGVPEGLGILAIFSRTGGENDLAPVGNADGGQALRLQARSRLPSPRRLAPPSGGMPRALRETAKRDDRAKRTLREPIATRLRRGPCAAFLSPYSFVPTPQRRTGEERRHFRACLPLAASQRLSALLWRIVYATQATLRVFRLRRRYKVHSYACDCKLVANAAPAKQCLKSWAE